MSHRPRRLMTLCVAVLAARLVGCNCAPDPDDISVDPDCPDGTAAAATVMIQADLAGINTSEDAVNLRIRGNRNVDADLCFQPGAEQSFLETAQGSGPVSVSVPNLAHGPWSVEITALSGGGHAPIDLAKTLQPGQTHTLSISATAGGGISAQFTN